MPPTVSDTKKPQIPTLPSWLTLPVGFFFAFFLGERYGFPWWLRFAVVVAVILLIEAVNQAVRRMASSGKSGDEARTMKSP